MKHYYNEFDRGAAAWLRELMNRGLIPKGDVDERSIREVKPNDLVGYTQCHFFAGIGGWPLALRTAGWPDDREIWTGSCPCQPFSAAGKRKGIKDSRHLWPWFRHLIFRGRPPVAAGEQVASADGRLWLAGVRANLETLGYAVGAADLCAAGVAAPHIRQRLFWVADASGVRCSQRISGHGAGEAESAEGGDGGGRPALVGVPRTAGGRTNGRLVNPILTRLEGHAGNGDDRDEPGRLGADAGGSTAAAGATGGVADADGRQSRNGRLQRGGEHGQQPQDGVAGPWSDFDLIPCRDGKARRVESGTFPLAHGVPARVGRLRGYGNAIVPQVAAEFIAAFMEEVA